MSYYERLSEFDKGTVLCLFRIENLNHINKPEDERFINLNMDIYFMIIKDKMK